MATDHRAGAGAVDVDVARHQFGFDSFDIRGAAREESGGQRVVGVVRDANRFVEVTYLEDTEDGSKNFFAGEPQPRFDVDENGRRNEEAFGRNGALEGQGCFLFSSLNYFQLPPVGG